MKGVIVRRRLSSEDFFLFQQEEFDREVFVFRLNFVFSRKPSDPSVHVFGAQMREL